MKERFLLYVDGEGDRPVGLRYDNRPEVNLLEIGGYARDKMKIEQLALRHFDMKVFDRRSVRERWTQKNKFKFVGRVPRKRFVDGVDSLREAGVSVVATDSLHRVMR